MHAVDAGRQTDAGGQVVRAGGEGTTKLKSFSEVNKLITGSESERFTHPLTGFELPPEMWFATRSCILIDNNRTSCPPRGLIHYLATGGGDIAGGEGANAEYINPGDAPAWLHFLDRKIDELRTRIDREDSEMIDMQSVLWDMEEKKPTLTPAQILEMLDTSRSGLESIKQMEEHLKSVSSLSYPEPERMDEIRRAIAKQRSTIDHTIQQAKESEKELSRQETLRAAIARLHEQGPALALELRRLELNRDLIAEHGFVKVTSSGWQRGVEHDVLSATPKYSWSDYCWEAESSSAHPRALPAGAWFQIQLPQGLGIIPSHYALRHGDDGCSTAPALRHDSNCSLFSIPGMPAQGVGNPATSWGSNTRAKKRFNGTALLNWQLWASNAGSDSGWTLLRDHVNDRALHAAFQFAVWPLPWQERREFSIFRVIMTGPCSSGAHALMCSGFELYGQVGHEVPPPPKAQV